MKTDFDFDIEPWEDEEQATQNHMVLEEFEDGRLLTPENMPRAPKTVPHCDCESANAAAGKDLSLRVTHQYGTVPTTVDVNDACVHCGHVAIYRSIDKINKSHTSKEGRSRSLAGQTKPRRAPKPGMISLWNRQDEKKIIKELKLKQEAPIDKAVVLIKGV